MTKKLIAITMVVVLLVSMLAVTANAASYSKGTYTVNTSAGLNVRPSPGASTRVGAASKGVTFTVSKISGNWGYTSSIRCTNGTKSGWVCLDYCKYKSTSSNSNRSTYNDVFTSVKGRGYSLSQARASEATTFNKGTFVYVWGYLHDASNNLYKTYGSGTCNMTLSIYRPNGSLAYSYTYKNCDNNWIGQKLDQAGTWKIQSKITGALSGTNTRYITVKDTTPTATYYTLSYNANGGSGAPSSQRVKANTGFYLSTTKPVRSGHTFLGWSVDRTASSASYSPGAGVKISSNTTLYAVWKKNTVNPTGVSLNYTSYTMNVGNTKQLTATVTPSNASNKSVTWSSNDTAVVTVSSGGKLTAKAPGEATVTVRTSNGKTKTCKVTVRGIKISGIPAFTTMTVGDVEQLYANVYPADSARVTWSTSNSRVASINSRGKITAKSAGTVTITAKTSDGRKASLNITVFKGKEWQTGLFDDGYTAKGYTEVVLNSNVGDGYMRIYTYDKWGNKTSGEIHVTLRDVMGNWICEFDAKSGDKLTLGDDHMLYRVYVARKKYPDTVFGNGDDFTNLARCQQWAIQAEKNCYIL